MYAWGFFFIISLTTFQGEAWGKTTPPPQLESAHGLIGPAPLPPDFSPSKNQAGFFELPWGLLATLDLKSLKPSANLQKVLEQPVELRGLMIPMDYGEQKTVQEFLLVDSFYSMACAHVPPPAPNQIVSVKMKKGKSTPVIFDEVRVRGVLSLGQKHSDAYFQLVAQEVHELSGETP